MLSGSVLEFLLTNINPMISNIFLKYVAAIIVMLCVLSVYAEMREFGLGCLDEPPGALDGVPRYTVPVMQERTGPGLLLFGPSYPSAVDNSIWPWFPPIKSQGTQNSCSAWGTTYFYLGYLQRRDRGWSGDDPSTLFSPAFTYNQVRSHFEGSSISDYMRFLTRFGACTESEMAYDQNDTDTQPSTNAFKDATFYRTIGWSVFPVTNNDAVVMLKQYLASTNIAVTSMQVYNDFVFTDSNGVQQTYYRYTVPGTANVMTAQSGLLRGGHCITVVGYDDNRRYGPGVDDKGAFKIANSWGDGWGNDGFFWVSYDYFKSQGSGNYSWDNDNNVYVMWARDAYTPEATLTLHITHPNREQLRVAVGVKEDGTEIYRYYYAGCSRPDRISTNVQPPYLYINPGGEAAFPDLVLDVSELLHYTKDNGTNTWVVMVGDAYDDGVMGTVDYVRIDCNGAYVETNVAVNIGETMADGEDLNTQVELQFAVDRIDPKLLFLDNDHSQSGLYLYPGYSNYKCYSPGYETDPLSSLVMLANQNTNFAFQVINRDIQSLDQSTLNSYEKVFWLTGLTYSYSYPSACPISSSDRTMLENYLDQGGRLFLTGEATVPSLGNANDFVTNYLRISSTAWVTSPPPQAIYLYGSTNDPVADGMVLPYDRGISFSENFQQRANITTPGDGAEALFTRSEDGMTCGVRYDSGSYRTVTLPFDLYGVADIRDRYRLMQRSLEWLQASNEVDLALSMTVLTNSVNVGELVGYRLVISNKGPDHATGIIITNQIVPEMTLQGHMVSTGTYLMASGIWTIDVVNAEATATLWLTNGINAGAGGMTLTNKAHVVDVDQPDFHQGDNETVGSVYVALADVNVIVSASDEQPVEGQDIVFNVIASNQGPDTITSLSLSAPVNSIFTNQGYGASMGVYDVSSGIWTVGTLNAGAASLLWITNRVLAGAGGVFATNLFSINAMDQEDPQLMDNTTNLFTEVWLQLSVQSMYGESLPITGVYNYAPGSSVTCFVTNSPKSSGETQWMCVGWSGEGNVPASGTTTNAGPFFIMTNSSITWLWSTNYYLTLSTVSSGSVDQTSNWYACGSNIVVMAAPQDHYHFVQWSGDTNGCVINSTSITVTIDAPKAIFAEFEIDQHSLSVNSVYGNSDPVPGVYWYDYGSLVSCVITNNPLIMGISQYVCMGWSGSGSAEATGVSTNTGLFVLTNNSSISWQWSTNTSPTASTLLTPIHCPDDDYSQYGRTLNRRPVLIWQVPVDQQGDVLHFNVYADSTLATTMVADSMIQSESFEYYNGSFWQVFPSNGVPSSNASGQVRFKFQGDLSITSYAWKVVAKDTVIAGVPSETNRFVVVQRVWLDSDLSGPFKAIRKIHMDELREEINFARLFRGLSTNEWTDAVITPRATPIRSIHFMELRQSIETITNITGETIVPWQDSIIVPRQTPISTNHILQLRKALEGI